MVELALHVEAQATVTSLTIAEKRHIPEKYLVHILLQLKRAGLVRSVRGAAGGYILGRAPEQVSLLDIVEAIDGPILSPLPVNDGMSGQLEPAWMGIAAAIEDVLRGTTVRDILDEAGSQNMYYI